jgi:hypothetical protein
MIVAEAFIAHVTSATMMKPETIHHSAFRLLEDLPVRARAFSASLVLLVEGWPIFQSCPVHGAQSNQKHTKGRIRYIGFSPGRFWAHLSTHEFLNSLSFFSSESGRSSIATTGAAAAGAAALKEELMRCTMHAREDLKNDCGQREE